MEGLQQRLLMLWTWHAILPQVAMNGHQWGKGVGVWEVRECAFSVWSVRPVAYSDLHFGIYTVMTSVCQRTLSGHRVI